MSHVPLHISQTTQRDYDERENIFPAAPDGSFGLVQMSERSFSQPLNLAVCFDWLIAWPRGITGFTVRETRPDSCTGPNRGQSSTALSAKLVIRRISVLAKGATDILACPEINF